MSSPRTSRGPFWDGGLLNPLGDFIPYKVGALFAMVFLGLWSLTVYLRAVSREQMRPGVIGRRSQALLLGLGVVVSVMMIVMGVIRENSRQPYLISGQLTIHEPADHQLAAEPGRRVNWMIDERASRRGETRGADTSQSVFICSSRPGRSCVTSSHRRGRSGSSGCTSSSRTRIPRSTSMPPRSRRRPR